METAIFQAVPHSLQFPFIFHLKNKLLYGHEETGEGSHKSIREKDEIYKKLFKSEKAQNAGPYARLKAAMDYWCALWFWPIDKADLLPSRQEFFFDMSLILEGNIRAVNVNSSGQMVFKFEEDGSGLKYVTEGNQLALDFKALYSDLGEVCLDNLRERSERLAIANKIAEEQRFQHWELEFADVFDENGGFDLVIGNPPWIKYKWNEMSVLSDCQPLFAIKDFSAPKIKALKMEVLENQNSLLQYIDEYTSVQGTLSFLNSSQNYSMLSGVQTNLYKCFLPKAWEIGNSTGVSAFVHPDGVFDDSNGGMLRKEIYKRFVYHFHFINEKLLFAEVGHPEVFSLNVYSNAGCNEFTMIGNLFDPKTIDQCFDENNTYPSQIMYRMLRIMRDSIIRVHGSLD